ncbi:MAG: DNA-directed RNA polymerase subunit beta' [Parcubacteria group bacterium]|nr:DNA-directed RNA polymerase subunit beta' [Parcubacteria group bacterium]
MNVEQYATARKKGFNFNDFDHITLRLASPETILGWSYGEILKPETINYRTQRSERTGLFCEKIFGPEKDYECYCGKYKGIRYKGIVCEKCGVEITRSIVRRERMGHIELAAPVSHIWFLRGVPSRIGLLMNLPVIEVEKVIYFAGYVVTRVNDDEKSRLMKELDSEYKGRVKQLPDEKSKDKMKELLLSAKRELDNLREGVVLDEGTYHKFSVKYGSAFEAGIGAEAIYDIFKKLDLVKMKERLEVEYEKAAVTERVKVQKRLGLVKSLINSGVRPEWMFLTVIAITPPALRPMIPLDGGRHATSDVNDLYRRVINRNNRLKKLKEIGAPDVILRNEKRILQEAVDALIDNSARKQTGAAMSQAQRRALKSLSDVLKGKQGLFRQNLLGKRVDYSGRSVIVVGPDLKLNQCGLPKHLALELFRPFVVSKILEAELAYNIRGANRLIDEGVPEVWALLEEVIQNRYVLLNRAPTLHRLGIQAFHPILVEGSAIQVHPLVCSAFNADFDGDQMAVHVPLSTEAQKEADELMSASKNLLKPGNGEAVSSAKLLDIVLGCYWTTKIIPGEKGEGKIFPNPNSAIMAYDFGKASMRAKITVLGTDSPKYAVFEGKPFETSIGRLLFNSVLPKDFPFLNKEIDRKVIAKLVDDIVATYGIEGTPDILDKVKAFGFKYVTKSGITWGIDDVKVPAGKKEIIKKYQTEADDVSSHFAEGLLSETERYRKTIEVWQGAINEIEKIIPETLEKHGSVYDMVHSGARGSISQIVQMVGIKGLIVSTTGKTIDFPVKPSNKEGLSPLEYFISTHGSRKGLTDTALNTAKAGYLTRRLVYVADSVVISEEDCGEKNGIPISKQNIHGLEIPISKHLRGRTLARDVVSQNGETLFKKKYLLTKADAKKIEEAGVQEVFVRSALTCKSVYGMCQQCYGLDLGRNKLVLLGEAVGVVAAQAIGEPGTQLTMRTFHAGGIAQAGGDITAGLPRVEEIFERRSIRSNAIISKTDGVVMEAKQGEKETIIKVLADGPQGKDKKAEMEYATDFRRVTLVKSGDKVEKGDVLTDGSGDIAEIFKYGGKEKAENYIISEISKVYELQGASIDRKHLEVVIRQMFSRRIIRDSGDTRFNIGQTIENVDLYEENERVKAIGGKEARGDMVVLGISEISLTTRSFLSAASFQNTSRILIDAAIKGGSDDLSGLKENILIGRLIPVGTGFRTRKQKDSGEEETEEVVEEAAV